jgi:hypothetical protein
MGARCFGLEGPQHDAFVRGASGRCGAGKQQGKFREMNRLEARAGRGVDAS